MTTHLFVIANVKQLRTDGSFRILLPFFRTSWGVGFLNSATFNSFHNRVEFGTILEGLRNFGGGGVQHPPPTTTTTVRPCLGVKALLAFENNSNSSVIITIINNNLITKLLKQDSIAFRKGIYVLVLAK